jgi:acyl-CoA synthetase (AMP-forming)/AMP-acid ligase II
LAWFSPDPLLLPELIALNSRWLADKPALIVDDQATCWREFGERTARVANALDALGMRPGDRAAVLMRNSAEMAEAMFGAIRAGVCVVPLNVAVSDEAVAGMIADSGATLVFASDEHVARIDGLRERLGHIPAGRFISIDAGADGWQPFPALLAGAGTEPPNVEITPAHECNIIYSSGTTGLPKGIVHDHRCRAAWAMDMTAALRYDGGARTLCSLGLYSNISWVAMLSTIYAGGTIVVERRFSPETCLATIQARRVTHSAMVPVQLQRLLALPDYDRFDLSSLRSLMCCGSPLSPELKRAIMTRIPGDFIELYGLTEGLVTTMPPEEMAGRLDSVGRPCPGQDLRILDNDDKPVAAGEAGEIVGRSRLMMAGYHGNEAATRDATWQDDAGRRWLRTGDIGRLDEQGYLYLVDRKKDMIISGGQNVFPADIEAVLLQHEGVSEVAVIGVTSERWGETPLAVVVPAAGVPMDADALVGWANARLGKQQRIAAAVSVEELPRNPNGKVLKRELRRHYADLRL